MENLPDAPPLTGDSHFDKAMDAIRSFELEQMSYSTNQCEVCNEVRIIPQKDDKEVCSRCKKDKSEIKMFSEENNMNPGKQPEELCNLTTAEMFLICYSNFSATHNIRIRLLTRQP